MVVLVPAHMIYLFLQHLPQLSPALGWVLAPLLVLAPLPVLWSMCAVRHRAQGFILDF